MANSSTWSNCSEWVVKCQTRTTFSLGITSIEVSDQSSHGNYRRLQRWNHYVSHAPEVEIPLEDNLTERKSWDSPDHTSLRILHRVPKKVQQPDRVAALHRFVRLSAHCSHNRWFSILRPCGTLSNDLAYIWYQRDQESAGNPSWGSIRRSCVVRSRLGHLWVYPFSQRRRIHVWNRRCK